MSFESNVKTNLILFEIATALTKTFLLPCFFLEVIVFNRLYISIIVQKILLVTLDLLQILSKAGWDKILNLRKVL